MAPIRYFLCLVLIAFPSAQAEQKLPTGYRLDDSSLSEVNLPAVGDIPYLLGDFEYLEGEKPKVFIFDFNDDGALDYFVASSKRLCGTGGCLYALIDGKTKTRIGDFFGSPILILDQKINGFPVKQTYAHLSVDSGGFATYVYDGKKYQLASSVYVEAKSLKELFKQLSAFRKIPIPKPGG